MNYPNFYQQQYYPPVQPQMQPQMQNGGFMSIRSEQDARSYPVAPGSVMTFKIENQPYVCEKAQGFSQLEGPIFNKYRLVKEESNSGQIDEIKDPNDASSSNDKMKEIWREIESLKQEISILKEGV